MMYVRKILRGREETDEEDNLKTIKPESENPQYSGIYLHVR